jgi:hypothetical protein
MYDEMVDDIFDQQFKKPRKTLNQLKPYKDDEYLGDDDFDIAYRTPTNIDVTDLLPTEWEEHKIGDIGRGGKKYGIDVRGQYHRQTKTIHVPNDDFFKSDAVTKNRVLLHENIHSKFDDKRDNYIEKLAATNDPIIITEISAANTLFETPTRRNSLNNFYDEYEKRDQRILSQNEKEYTNSKPEELFAHYGSKFPEDILNPTNKISKKLNRIFFD